MDFIQEYFINPITNPAYQGYNIVNTLIFIILLVIACSIIYYIFRKKIDFNYNFLVAMLPYILFGISMRVIMHRVEAGLLVIEGITKTANPFALGFWFFTPGIWLLTLTLVIIGLLLGEVWKKLQVQRTLYFGIVIAIIPFLFNLINFSNWFVFIIITIIVFGVSYISYFAIDKFTKYKIRKDKLNFLIIIGQGFDGIASAIAIAFFSFSEQHVFSNMLMQIHPGLFASVKLLIAILICYVLDDYSNEVKSEEKKNLIGFVKIVIAILGLATGLASLFKLGFV
jgi:uncharacterized membrane protein